MIEDLESEAVAQLADKERGGMLASVWLDHNGIKIEVHARRRMDGAAVLGYSYGGVRLERAVLLLLICPEDACERSRKVKLAWRVRKPAPPALQRRPRTALKGAVEIEEARLFDEVSLDSATGSYVARPASLKCLVVCPVQAHGPTVMRKSGWDLFHNGKYVAGGVLRRADTGESAPHFPSLKAATYWLSQGNTATSSLYGGCDHE